MNRSYKIFLCLFWGVMCFIPSCYADEITLTNGTKIICVIIAKDAKALIAETEYGTLTLEKKAVQGVRADTAETNFILRGDFFKAKGKLEEAMRFYGEAMLVNPKSKTAKEKYDEAHKAVEEVNKQQLLGYSHNETLEPKVTKEDVEGGMAKKKLNPRENLSLQSEGSGLFPAIVPPGESKDRIALELAKRDALNKIFPQGVGIGFKVSGDKVQILPEGELPNCKISVSKQEKTALGFKVTLQITGPAESVMVNIPKGYPIIETVGQTENIKAKTQNEVRLRALNDAYQQGIKQVIKDKMTAEPKLKGKKFYGRLYLITIEQENLTPMGYVMKVKLIVWIDPSSES